MLRLAAVFATGLAEMYTPPKYRRGETDALAQRFRERADQEKASQQLAYVLQLKAHGSPEALARLTTYAPKVQDPKVLAVLDQAAGEIRQKAEMATALRQTMGPKGEQLAGLLEAGIPPALVPAYATALSKAEDPLNQIKFFPELGGYYIFNKRTGKPEFFQDERLKEAVKLSKDPAARLLQDAVSVSVSGLPLEQLIKAAQAGDDPTAKVQLKSVVSKLADKNVTSTLDQMTLLYVQEKGLKDIRNWSQLAEQDPTTARKIFDKYRQEELAFRAEITGASGLAAALSRQKAELGENPIFKAAEGRFIRKADLAPGKVTGYVTTLTKKQILERMETGELVPILDPKALDAIKGMEVIEQQLIPEMQRVMAKLPKTAGFSTLVTQLANPGKRYLGVSDEVVQIQGASGAFAIQLAKTFQGGAAALSDADRRAAQLLTMHDGDTTGSVAIKIGIMQRMAGAIKAVKAGVDPRSIKAVYTDAEVDKLETDLQRTLGETAPLGPGIRFKTVPKPGR